MTKPKPRRQIRKAFCEPAAPKARIARIPTNTNRAPTKIPRYPMQVRFPLPLPLIGVWNSANGSTPVTVTCVGAAGSMAVGTTFRVIVCGKVYSTASAKAIEIAVKLGSVPLFDYTLTPGIATKGFRIEAIATVRSTGASGSIVAAGAYLSQTTCLGAAPLATATIDTTVDQTFDVTVAPAQANSGDGADVVLATIERLN